MNSVAASIGICVVIFVAVLSWLWHFNRSRTLLDRWAEENGYEILSSERRIFSRGPFFWTTGKGQVVYYVAVRDSAGNPHSGWVRCGGYFLGLLSDNVDVHWDDER